MRAIEIFLIEEFNQYFLQLLAADLGQRIDLKPGGLA
jgi:hypothetical protein